MYSLNSNLESLKSDLIFIISNSDEIIDMNKELQIIVVKMIPYITTSNFSNIPTIIACNMLLAIIETDYDLSLEFLNDLINQLDN